MSSLSHHGIKGQRWGVRRFQNKDGTRTALGKKQLKAKRLSRNEKGIRDVYRSLSDEDFRTLGYSKEEADQERKDDFLELGRRHTDYDQYNRVRYKDGKAVGYIAATGYQTTVGRGKKIVNILAVDLAVHSEYRGNGYSVALGKDLVRWFDTYGSKEYDRMEWYAMSENIGSQKAAERSGFTRRSSKEAAKGWVKYRYDKKQQLKHTAMDASPYLSHHGIKGQRWGVRRFQNADGTRTAAGKKRYSVEAVDVNSSRKEIKKLVKGFSRKDKEFFFGRRYWDDDYDKGTSEEEAYFGVKKRFVIKEGKDIVAFIDAQQTSEHNSELNMVIGTKASARGKGYASALAEKMVDWYDSEGYKSNEGLRWQAANENTGSRKIAEKTGFKQIDDDGLFDDEAVYAYSKNGKQELDKLAKEYANKKSVGKEVKDKINSDFKTTRISKLNPTTEIEPYGWVRSNKGESEWSRMKANLVDAYAERWVKKNHSDDLSRYDKASSSYGKAMSNYYKKRKVKHTSIGGTMYIEGNALILGDSSYLEHHGIRGQKWGVRRFQNRDGSLTNAGRKRLGYATKGAAQTVGKAFKAGVKAGGNAVKAVKAHHEKKEAEKLEKKKEKASKTRLGVMANKDLFTNEEIRKLNERFKLEDEMKMATLQKGVEIAKAVGTIAQNVGTVAKTYEDVTGQSLSPIKRKAAEEKARQDKEDRERRIAREDADEARKAAKEERDIAIHEQTLRKAIAAADTQEFTAQKTKAEADSSVLDAIKKGQDFNGGSDATGQSWVEKAKSGGKNPFDDMIANRDPEYAQIRKEHDEKVARKERIAELERREKEREAEKAAKDQALKDMINQSNARTGRGQSTQPKQDSDALFSQKGSLPIDKDRYRNNRAMEKAKQVKEDAAEERAKKQDEKAAKATIDDMMEARRQFTDSARANSNGAFDRETAANYIKGKAKELPNKLNPVNAIAKKIANKALKEEEDNARKAMEDEYKKASRSQGRDEANYTMYYNRVNALQAQGYSERQAKKVADTERPFSSKRNRRFEYNEKVDEIETTHRKNSKEINKANKELTDYYYKLVNGPGYEPGSPKREELDRKYAQKRGELERLEKDNNDMLDREKKKAKKILEHSFTIQNGVLFVDSSDGLTHHGIKGQRWGVRRFQNPDGTLTDAGKRREARRMTKELNRLDSRMSAASREHASLNINKTGYENRVNKLSWKKQVAEQKGNEKKAAKLQAKIDKGKANVERVNKMMDFASKDYTESYYKIDKILKEIDANADYAWKSGATIRQYRTGGFYKDMLKADNKRKWTEGTYYQSAYGNAYKVKHDKKRNKKDKWAMTKHTQYGHSPIHTEVHYY